MFDARRRQNDAGFTSIEWIVCAAFSMLVLVMLMNLMALQYGRGVLRAASDEGARVGARVADPANQIAACQARQAEVLNGIGAMATDRVNTCEVGGGQIRATTSATFSAWLPLIPDFHSTEIAVSRAEQAPQ